MAAKRKNSRAKGKRGELELAAWLREWVYLDGVRVTAERGQQRKGGADSPDVTHSIPYAHFEVCRTEALGIGTEVLRKKLNQAEKDAGPSKVPCVVWRRNRLGWNVTTWQSSDCPWTADLADWMTSRGYRRIEKKAVVTAGRWYWECERCQSAGDSEEEPGDPCGSEDADDGYCKGELTKTFEAEVPA